MAIEFDILKKIEGLPDILFKDKSGCGIPSISTTLKRLLSLDMDGALSVHELAEAILEDYGLISKVLQTVNTVYYNRTGQQITTVTQAVILLGFDTIRQVAMGMSILNLAGEEANKTAARVITEAFIAAHLAQELEGGSDSVINEELYISALFRRLARIFTAVSDPGFYQVLEQVERTEDRHGRVLVRNLWREIGYRLAGEWNLPRSIAGNLEGCRSASVHVDRKVGMLVRTASDLAGIPTGSVPADEAISMIEVAGKGLGVSAGKILEKLDKVVKRVEEASALFEGSIRYRCSRDALSCDKVEVEEPSKRATGGQANDTSLIPRDNDELFFELLNQMGMAASDTSIRVDQIFLLAVEILKRAMDLDNILLVLITPDRKRLIARYGLGEQVGLIKKTLSIPLPFESAALNEAFKTGQEILTTWDNVLASVTDAGLVGMMADRSVCVSPIVVKGRILGCFLMDRATEALGQRDLKKITSIRQLVVLATANRTMGV